MTSDFSSPRQSLRSLYDFGDDDTFDSPCKDRFIMCIGGIVCPEPVGILNDSVGNTGRETRSSRNVSLPSKSLKSLVELPGNY